MGELFPTKMDLSRQNQDFSCNDSYRKQCAYKVIRIGLVSLLPIKNFETGKKENKGDGVFICWLISQIPGEAWARSNGSQEPGSHPVSHIGGIVFFQTARGNWNVVVWCSWLRHLSHAEYWELPPFKGQLSTGTNFSITHPKCNVTNFIVYLFSSFFLHFKEETNTALNSISRPYCVHISSFLPFVFLKI